MLNALILIASLLISFYLVTLIREHGIKTVIMHPVYVVKLSLPLSAPVVCTDGDLPYMPNEPCAPVVCTDGDLPYMPNEPDGSTVCLWCTAPTVRGTKVCATHYGC